MGNKVELSLRFEQPVYNNTTRTISANAVMFHNVGQQSAMIDKHWEIPPGGMFSFGSTENPHIMFSQRFRITFTGSGSKKLQIAVTVAKSAAVSNYSESKDQVRK